MEQNLRRKDEYVYQILSLARSLIAISQGTVGKKNSLPKFSYEELLIIPKDICNLEENYDGKIDDYQLCASAINKNVRVCSGDNGASFFCKNTGKIFFVNCSL